MANKQIRNPGQLSRFDAQGRISADVPSFAVDTGQAARALAQAAGSLGDTLGRLADRAAQREGELAGLTAGQQSGAQYLQARAVETEAAAVAGKGPWMEQAKALLRDEEGFRDKPYWDTNAHRVGYGSDTHVTADGSIVKVTPGMRITRDDAERDLTYRLTSREGKRVQEQLGPAWEKLPDGARAALASVGYNYGSLPASVVAAAKSGDLNALAGAVEGLAANKGRRRREAALIRGGTIEAGRAPAAARGEALPVVQASAAPLSTTPLALRRDGTIRGEAFDQAAGSAYAWRMQEGLSQDLFAAQAEFRDDPAGFAGAIGKIRGKYLQDASLSDPVMREQFDKYFADRTTAYQQDIATRHEARLREEQQASFAGGYAAQLVDIERQAQVMGASPDADKVIGGQVATFQASIDGALASGTITPAQAAKYKLDVAETAARGRIQGVYEALPTPERRREFALSLLDDWREGKGPLSALPFETVKGISDTLRRDAEAKIEGDKAQKRIEAARLSSLIDDDVASLANTGKGLDAGDALAPDQVASVLGADKLQAWQLAREKAGRTFDATAGMETQSAADIEERLALLAPKAGAAGYSDQVDIFAAAQKRATAVLKARADDPAAAVESSFPQVKELADQADPAQPDTMRALVAARLQAQSALGIADLAQEPLTNAEAQNLARAISGQPDPGQQSKALLQVVEQISVAYGPHAERVLAQVLASKGIDKEMAQIGAVQLRRLSKGGGAQVPAAERRAASVIDETGVAEAAARPLAYSTGGTADPTAVQASPSRDAATMPLQRPSLAAIQYLRENPGTAAQFDALFGPGAAALYAKP